MANENNKTQRKPVEIRRVLQPAEQSGGHPLLTLDEYVAQDKIHRNIAAGMKVLYGEEKRSFTAWKDAYTAFMNMKV